MKICCFTSWNDDMKENDDAFQKTIGKNYDKGKDVR